LKALSILLSISLLSGCVFRVPLEPNPKIAVPSKIPVDLGLFVDHANELYIYKARGLAGCLMGGQWELDTGVALRKAAERAFSQAFRNVTVLDSIQDFQNEALTILILPEIERFEVKNNDIRAEIHIHCRLVDKLGNALYEKNIDRAGNRKILAACCLGATGGGFALSRTSQEAFNKAFQDLVTDVLKNVDFTP
jgi:hypothetical protein